MSLDDNLVPYQLPFPTEALDEIVIPNALTNDEWEWVPQAENVWFRPICLNRSRGYWATLLKVRKSGILSRHRHPQPVHGIVLKGKWHYLEHDWVADEGSYVFEPPGETHTLMVPRDVEKMVTFFQVNGAMVYVDPQENTLGYEDIFSKIYIFKRHYENIGLGGDYISKYIR